MARGAPGTGGRAGRDLSTHAGGTMTVDPAGERRPTGFGELASDALRYWEPRRLIYNAVLFAVVCIHIIAGWPASRTNLNRDVLFMLFMLAVLANIAYCAAYAVDLFVQFSGSRQTCARRRWVLLLVGTAFAAILAHFFSYGFFGSAKD
jgi:hypothetical protein